MLDIGIVKEKADKTRAEDAKRKQRQDQAEKDAEARLNQARAEVKAVFGKSDGVGTSGTSK